MAAEDVARRGRAAEQPAVLSPLCLCDSCYLRRPCLASSEATAGRPRRRRPGLRGSSRSRPPGGRGPVPRRPPIFVAVLGPPLPATRGSWELAGVTRGGLPEESNGQVGYLRRGEAIFCFARVSMIADQPGRENGANSAWALPYNKHRVHPLSTIGSPPRWWHWIVGTQIAASHGLLTSFAGEDRGRRPRGPSSTRPTLYTAPESCFYAGDAPGG